MELYGSLFNISGSVTASAFTGSYIGDGAGLYNLPASGVTGLNLSQISSGSAVASITPTGFTVNTNTTITGSLIVTGTVLSQTTTLVSGSPQISISGTTGYSTFSSSLATTTSNLSSSIGSLSSSVATTTLDLSSSINGISSSVATTTFNLSSDINGVSSSVATTTSNLSSSIGSLSSSVATTDLAQTNRLVSIESKTGSYATTGSNIFVGNQTISGSITPSVDNTYDLGSPTHQWRDVYISSGSLYIDGTKVIGSTTQELTITTDTGQSIKILEAGSDSIILQTADGDIELKSSGGGDVLLDPTNGIISIKGTTQVQDGYKITSSGGTNVVFGDGVIVSGSIELTGTIDGIDLQALSSSLNTRLSNLESSGGSLNSFTASATNRLSAIETATSSLNGFTSSIDTTIKSKLNAETVVSGSSQIILTGTTGYSTFSSSVSASIGDLSGSVATTTSGLSSTISSLSSSVATTTLNTKNRVDSIESKTGSYATTGSNIFQGSQTITGSLYISQNLIVQGSSSITYVTSSQLRVEDNIITVNTSNPIQRFGGLEVYDSGSVTQATGSILWDSVNNRWIYQQSSEATYGGGVLMSGPRSSGSLGSELTLTSNKVAKSAGGDHLNDSNITDSGTLVSVNSNTEITGTLKVTGEITSTFSSGDEGGQINLATPQTNTTLVGGLAIDVYQNRLRFFEQGGTARGGYFDISSLSAGASTNLMGTAATASYVEYSSVANKPALVSGSAQISFNGITDKPTLVSGSSQITFGSVSGVPSGLVSGSSQVLSGTGIWSGSAQLPSGVVSGSSQIAFGSITGVPGGLVSGSSQIDLTSTTNYTSGILTRLNAVGVFSGSAQVSFGSISGVPSGLVSGSSQVLSGTGIWSGSAQLPSGVVSGSAQITLSSTTGFGSYLNQAVLTSSTPTFSGAILTNVLRGGIGAATTTGTLNWNDSTNARSGQGYTLLTGNATNGPGPSEYFHPFSFEYSSWDGSGNMTQFAIPYNANQTSMYFRGRYASSWGSWYTMWNSGNDGSGSGLDADLWDGYHFSDYLNQAVKTTSSPTFAGVTLTGAYSGSGGLFSHNIGNPSSTTELFVHNGANTPVPFRMTKAGYSGAGGSYGILQLYMNDNTNGNGANLYFCANNSAGTFTEYGGVGMQIKSNTASSETARLFFYRQGRAVNGTFDSDGTLYTVGNIYVNGNGTTTGTQVVYNSGTWGIGISGNAATVTNGVYTTSNNTMTGGNKIVIQNSQDGGSGRGIFMWNSSDSNWGIYMSQAGASKALNDTTAASGLDGRTEHAIRFRVASSTTQIGFLWENSDNTALMQLQPNTGKLYTKAEIFSNAGTNAGGFYLGDTGAGLYRDNTYDTVLTQNNSSSGVLYLAGAGNVIVSIDNNNNETDRKFIVGSNAVKATNELFSVNESGNGYFSGTLQATSTLYVGGAIVRTAGGTGYLNGNYSSSETGNSTGAIYTIGGSYYPTISSLNNMYGIGYTNVGSGTAVQMTNVSGWGMYVAANGTPYVWLGAEGNPSVFRGNILPHSNNSYNLGSSSYGWANIYTNDLHLSNMNKPEGNDIDGTSGDWTIQEGAENLYIINNNNGKKFKIKLEEI